MFRRKVPGPERWPKRNMLLIVQLVLADGPLNGLTHISDWSSLFVLDLYHLDLSEFIERQSKEARTFILTYLLEDEHFGRSFEVETIGFHLVRNNNRASMQKLFEYDPERWQFSPRDWLSCVVEELDLEMMHWLLEHVPYLCMCRTYRVLHLVWNDRLDIVRFLFEKNLIDDPVKAAVLAAPIADLHLFQFLLARNLLKKPSRVAIDVACNGNLEVVGFMVDNNMVENPQSAAMSAAANGKQDVVEFLWDRNLISCVQCVVEHAIVNGYCDLVEWFEQLTKWNPTSSEVGVCGRPHELTAQCIKESSWLNRECFAARLIRKGALRGLRWLLHRFPEIRVDFKILMWLLRTRDMELFDWVLDQVLHTNEYKDWMLGLMFVDEALFGDERVLTRLVDANGTLGSVEQALANGEPELVKYITASGLKEFVTDTICQVMMCKWTCGDTMQRVVRTLCETCSGYDRKKVIEAAACTSGGLPLLKYFGVKDQPVEVQDAALQRAMWWRNYAIVEYLLDERMTTLYLTSDINIRHLYNSAIALLLLSKNLCSAPIVRWAADYPMMDVIRFAHQSGVEGFTQDTMDAAAAAGSLPIVQFLHEHRQEGCSTKAMNKAAAGGYLHVVKFLHEHRGEGCTSLAMDGAAENGHVRVVKFLDENRQEGCTTMAFTGAAAGGHLDVVKYLWQHHKAEADAQEALDAASRNSKWYVVYWLAGNVDATLDYEVPLKLLKQGQINAHGQAQLVVRLEHLKANVLEAKRS